MQTDEKLMTVQDVADFLAVPKRWVYEKTRFNQIPVCRVGHYCRFRRSDIEQWLLSLRDAEVSADG